MHVPINKLGPLAGNTPAPYLVLPGIDSRSNHYPDQDKCMKDGLLHTSKFTRSNQFSINVEHSMSIVYQSVFLLKQQLQKKDKCLHLLFQLKDKDLASNKISHSNISNKYCYYYVQGRKKIKAQEFAKTLKSNGVCGIKRSVHVWSHLKY